MRLFEFMNMITASDARAPARPANIDTIHRIIQPAGKAPASPAEVSQLIQTIKLKFN